MLNSDVEFVWIFVYADFFSLHTVFEFEVWIYDFPASSSHIYIDVLFSQVEEKLQSMFLTAIMKYKYLLCFP